MIIGLILGIMYIVALPFVFIILPGFKKDLGLESINPLGFLSIWLIMPLFLIVKFFKLW